MASEPAQGWYLLGQFRETLRAVMGSLADPKRHLGGSCRQAMRNSSLRRRLRNIRDLELHDKLPEERCVYEVVASRSLRGAGASPASP